MAGSVSKVFNNHKDKDRYTGKDMINGKECRVDFKVVSDGRVLSYHYDTGGYILENAMPDSYEKNMKGTWFEDSIYYTKKYSGSGVFDIVGSAIGVSNVKKYTKTLKFFYDKKVKITKVIYTNDLDETVISECQID